MTMTMPKCLQTMDAQQWARDFIETINTIPTPVIDEDIMIGWFANAIMVGYDTAMRKIDHMELCTNPSCDKGKSLCQDGTSRVEDCPVCQGRGFKEKNNAPSKGKEVEEEVPSCMG